MSLLVKVHQVVVLNISDHYTRNSLQNPQLPRRIVGILFGTQVGRTVNVIGSFEAKATINPSNN
jgi:COP9 signalosome complex subunit 6